MPPGTRTLTSGFGDRRAAVTPGARRCTGRGGGGDGWSRTSSLQEKRFYRPPRLTICAASPLQGRSISPAAISRIGLGDRDRTCGLTLPKRVLYLLSYTQRSRSRLRNGLHVANYRGCPGAAVSYRLGALPHDRSAAFVWRCTGIPPLPFRLWWRESNPRLQPVGADEQLPYQTRTPRLNCSDLCRFIPVG